MVEQKKDKLKSYAEDTPLSADEFMMVQQQFITEYMKKRNEPLLAEFQLLSENAQKICTDFFVQGELCRAESFRATAKRTWLSKLFYTLTLKFIK